MPPETRTRILDVTADLFRRYGYNGTGLKQIVAEANAPFGSLYHFFPDGKEQLGDAAIRQSGRMYLELFATIMGAAPDVVTGVARLLRRCGRNVARDGLRRRLPHRDGRARGRQPKRDRCASRRPTSSRAGSPPAPPDSRRRASPRTTPGASRSASSPCSKAPSSSAAPPRAQRQWTSLAHRRLGWYGSALDAADTGVGVMEVPRPAHLPARTRSSPCCTPREISAPVVFAVHR